MIGIGFIYPQFLWLLFLLPLTAGLALLGRRALSKARMWGGLALRLFLLLLIVLALSGIQLRLPSRTLTAVFVLDASDSVPPAEIDRGEQIIREAIEKMPAGDKAAIVVFGEDALVERLASADSTLAKLTSVPITTRTDIASALQLGMALFPGEGARRLVLLSDGRENLEYALKQAQLAALQDIQLEYVGLGESAGEVEVLVDQLDAPASIREGQSFDLTVVVQSSAKLNASLRLFADDQLISTQELSLSPGANRYTIPVKDAPVGFHRYRAQILPEADTKLQNNEASAFTVVKGPPSILIVEGDPGESDNLAKALEAAKMRLTVVAPGATPATLPVLAKYDAVILMNVPAADLPKGAMDALPVYVRDLGRGLLMTGGDTSFGAGGYLRSPLEKALPVYMDVKSKELAANLALVIAVDKSGSMGRCHCDNPDLNQTYTARETGQPKVDIAKAAIMQAAPALGPEDYLGVVAFDSKAYWIMNLTQGAAEDQATLEKDISTFTAGGQTNMASGMVAAHDALVGVNAKRKHIILMTDGWVRTGDIDPLVREWNKEGITISIVAAGEGSAQYLKALALDGGGTYYPAVDMSKVPEIFLKETIKSVGQYIIEEPFFPLAGDPSPIMKGINTTQMPGLFGYNGTSPKNNARPDLLTTRGDPLLYSWQYGLGRSAVWTSDLKGKWAAQWVKWEDFAKFATQLVGYVLPAQEEKGFTPHVSLTDNGAVLSLSAEDDAGQPWNYLNVQAKIIQPDLTTQDATLKQVGAGQYQVTVRADDPGAYLVEMSAGDGKTSSGLMTLGLIVPYSPEYRTGGTNLSLLDELARITKGGPLSEPVAAFIHDLPSADSAREVWSSLLLVVALLFPLDVAIRRVMLSPRDWVKFREWARNRLPSRERLTRRSEPVLNQLFSARERARARTGRGAQAAPQPRSTAQAQTPVVPPSQPAPEPPPPQRTSESPPDADSLSRLRAAKKRAQK